MGEGGYQKRVAKASGVYGKGAEKSFQTVVPWSEVLKAMYSSVSSLSIDVVKFANAVSSSSISSSSSKWSAACNKWRSLSVCYYIDLLAAIILTLFNEGTILQ